MKSFGRRIRELRQDRELSLRELAKKLEISAPFLSDIELGKRYPSEDVLASMARELGVSLEGLRTYDTRPPVEDIKRLAETNPAYGIAFKRLIATKVSPEDLINLAESKSKSRKKG
jgi:transcriptional regulator with XRE-family HTH domain